MRCQITKRIVYLLPAFAGLFLAATTLSGQQAGSPKGGPSMETISVNGKYSKLVRKLYFPNDTATYGKFCDFGYSPTSTYGQYKNLPRGYWVYAAPFWYLWQYKDSYKDDTLQRASVNGKYEDLLYRVPAPQSWKDYGKFKDFGYSTAKQFGQFNNLPPGYWVYVYPHWYIWQKRGAPLTGATLKASAGCKYSHLLKKISVPQDRSIYTEYFDEGYWDGSTYGPYMNLPTGFWVYNFPHWYIWGERQSIRAVVNENIAARKKQ